MSCPFNGSFSELVDEAAKFSFLMVLLFFYNYKYIFMDVFCFYFVSFRLECICNQKIEPPITSHIYFCFGNQIILSNIVNISTDYIVSTFFLLVCGWFHSQGFGVANRGC